MSRGFWPCRALRVAWAPLARQYRAKRRLDDVRFMWPVLARYSPSRAVALAAFMQHVEESPNWQRVPQMVKRALAREILVRDPRRAAVELDDAIRAAEPVLE